MPMVCASPASYDVHEVMVVAYGTQGIPDPARNVATFFSSTPPSPARTVCSSSAEWPPRMALALICSCALAPSNLPMPSCTSPIR